MDTTEKQINELREQITQMAQGSDRQTLLLEHIYKLLLHSLESTTTKDGKRKYHLRTKVIDFGMTFNSTMDVALKWTVALFVWGIIIGCIGGFFLSLLGH